MVKRVIADIVYSGPVRGYPTNWIIVFAHGAKEQGMLENIFLKRNEGRGKVVNSAPSDVPFFSAKIARDLLSELEEKSAASGTDSSATDMPLSPSGESAFNSAQAFQSRFGHSQIEPLHLLAALLTEESSQGVTLLQRSGITQEKLLLTLRAGREKI